jgi:hypothetical protein
MSWYRDVYLKSEDWQNLRAAIIALHNGRCYGCGCRSLSVDVHHIQYRKLFDVKTSDLRPLCRTCHDIIHQIIKMKYSNSRPIRRWGLALNELPCSEIVIMRRRCLGRLLKARRAFKPPRKNTPEIWVIILKARRRSVRAERHYTYLLQRIESYLDLTTL